MRVTHLILCIAVTALAPSTASAHCETADLDHALIWIKPAAESELRAAFKQAQKVRLGPRPPQGDRRSGDLHHRAKRTFKPREIARGREYVDAYVSFTHYAEQLYDVATARHTTHTTH